MADTFQYEPQLYKILEVVNDYVKKDRPDLAESPIAVEIHYDKSNNEVRLGAGFFDDKSIEGFVSFPIGINGHQKHYSSAAEIGVLALEDATAQENRVSHLRTCIRREVADLRLRSRGNPSFDPDRYAFLVNHTLRKASDIENFT